MIQTRPYEFMVKYTPQRDWIEGHGIMIALAFFLGGISGGLYLASLFFDNMLGMFIAWLAALVMGMVDMAHLTKPMRFWRMLLKPKTSWIARGFIFITLFIGCAAIQLALGFWLPGTAAETVFRVLAGILAFGVAIYSGFVVGYVGAIKLWNSAIVPILFVIAGLTGGLAVLLMANLGGNTAQSMAMANMMLIGLVVYAVLMVIYLWVTTYESSVAKDSVMRMLRGSIAPVFWVGVVVIGIIIPIAVLAPFSFSQQASSAAFIIAAICAILGGVALRYVILKAGIYSPLVPANE
ncbi:NrfD/PsrC family molybdoenzyme membrane anchor subunit [Chloroflexota bacterium]